MMTKEFKKHRMDMGYHVMLERSGKKKITASLTGGLAPVQYTMTTAGRKVKMHVELP
jgi:hypothetical protein